MLDDVAHDAQLVSNDEHVKSSATETSAAKRWAGRNGDVKDDAKDVAHHGFEHALAEGVVEAGEHIGSGATAAGGVVLSVALTAKFFYTEGWLKPHLKGDDIRAHQTNDAINVGVALSLASPPGFAGFVAQQRPGVEKGAEKVCATLKGKDAAMVPILQARSDEGFLATEKLYADAKSLPADKRATAIETGLAKLQERAKKDVAFGLGVQLAVWSTSQGGEAQRATADGVHARNIPMPFYTQG